MHLAKVSTLGRFRLHFRGFSEALGVIKTMTSLQINSYALLKMGMHFGLHF